MASEWAKDNVAILYLVHEGWRHRSPEPAPPFPFPFPAPILFSFSGPDNRADDRRQQR